MDKIVDFINVNRDRYIDEMKRYLAIPSISALPEHKGDVRKCAEWTADEMRRISSAHQSAQRFTSPACCGSALMLGMARYCFSSSM